MLVKHFSFLCTGVQYARLTLELPSRSTCVLADLVCGCGDPVHSGGELTRVITCSTVPDAADLAYHKMQF